MLPLKIYCNHSKEKFDASIATGFDLDLIFQTEKDWGIEKSKLASEILTKYPEAQSDIAVFCEAIKEFNVEDWGWSWSRKAMHCKPPRYEWFFLIADGATQGIAIIYHPEPSQLASDNIFYVDYLATAFWNRNQPNRQKRFSKVGSILLAHSIDYAMTKLNLRPGFSLHSLPGAEPYYLSLGMTDLGIDPKKEDLRRFEAAEVVAKGIKEASLG